jgi:hypothetical protein
LCDDALTEILEVRGESIAGVDLLGALKEAASIRAGGPCSRFWEAIHEAPPADIRCSDEEISRGTEFFVHNSTGILQCLMHYSLSGGFARYDT